MNKTKGFSLVGILVIVAAVVVLGIIAWRVWDAGQNKQSDSANTNQQTNDQGQDKEPEPEPATEVDPNEGYVVIKEWGVRFKPADGLEGVEYYRINDDENFFAFTTEQLAAADENCGTQSGNIVLGGLTRSTSPDGHNLGPINGYYYASRAANAQCASLPDLGPTTSKWVQSIKTLEAAK